MSSYRHSPLGMVGSARSLSLLHGTRDTLSSALLLVDHRLVLTFHAPVALSQRVVEDIGLHAGRGLRLCAEEGVVIRFLLLD